MALFVYVTEECRKDAITQGLAEDLDRLKDRVERAGSINLFNPFPPPYLVKKKLGGRQGRLVADVQPVGDHVVVVFLAVMIRGDRDYEDGFAKDPGAYGKQHFTDSSLPEQLARYVGERTREPLPILKEEPSEEEYAFLYNAFALHDNTATEEMVYETPEWVQAVNSDRISKLLSWFYTPCFQALSEGKGVHFIVVNHKPGWGVWAYRTEGRLLLLTPETPETQKQARDVVEAYTKTLADPDLETILQSSQRAYPGVILADDELWIDLEKEPVANMALSPEESGVLESVRTSAHPFPLFINGRAGSGKSTILQYLFADLLHYYLETDAEGMAPPIYLTANGELLSRARTFIERLLSSEAKFVQQSNGQWLDKHRKQLDSAFREFHPFLLSMLPASVRRDRFKPASRLGYPLFRRLWKERFGMEKNARRDYGPDISWHVIRTYIKGMDAENYLEPDDYRDLPENQITVTWETFKQVYEKVFVGWYQSLLQERSLWDDLDLTRYILENNCYKARYPAVLCDEAQDFTRLELDLLLRISLFSDRAIPPNDISRIPFAFAGDQFQTLNPTGFRWDAIKASFVEKFIYELDPGKRSGRTDLNYHELRYNYRSTRHIVKFGNYVQAIRAALFQLPDLQPQKPWTRDTNVFPVVWFQETDAQFWRKFDEAPGFVVIVPCNEGEEADYVQEHPVLREHIAVEDGVPANVLSASRAKGCEYPAVMVYGFGGAADRDITAELKSLSPQSKVDPNQSLPLQYFINRLYVAVSRPKRRLIVVDSKTGFDKLWRVAQEGIEDSLLRNIKNGPAQWGPEIEGMTVGNPDDLTREIAGNPLENALAFETDGITRHDPFLFKQAAIAYRNAGDTMKEKECRARAAELEEKFLDAGEKYFEAGFAQPEGVRCLWRAGKEGWAVLVERAAGYPQLQNDPEVRWAHCLTEESRPEDRADILETFARRLSEPEFAETCASEKIWCEAVESLLKRDIAAQFNAISRDPLNRMAVALDAIKESGADIKPELCAPVFYAAGKYREAAACWEAAGQTKGEAYLRAKAESEPYPKNVPALVKLGLHDRVIEAYHAMPDAELAPDQSAAIVAALCAREHFGVAYRIAWDRNNPFDMLHLALCAFKNNYAEQASQALHAAVVLLVEQNHWEPLARFVANREFAPTQEWNNAATKGWIASEADDMRIYLVRALARSEGLVALPPESQVTFSDFLNAYLRVKGGIWIGKVSIAEAGAAIERAGCFTEALAFYDAVVQGAFEDKKKAFARRRRLKCKKRQAQHLRTRGETGKAMNIEHDLEQLLKRERISSLESVSEYPKLNALDLGGDVFWPGTDYGQEQEADRQKGNEAAPKSGPATPPSQRAEATQAAPGTGAAEDGAPQASRQEAAEPVAAWSDPVMITMGNLEIELSRKNRRCNIKNLDSRETAYVKLASRACGGEAAFDQKSPGRWRCPDWKFSLVVPEQEKEPLCFEFDDLGVTLHLKR